jgi:hypothetical protein
MPQEEREALAERLREEQPELDAAEEPPVVDEGEPADEIEPIATPTDD